MSDEELRQEGERLQKVLAAAGVASRRACESLIAAGRVEVNGKVVDTLGSRVDPERDEVSVDGVVVQLDPEKRYFVLNKPTGIVSTMSDEHGRPDLREFTRDIDERLFNVGRLDTDTSGLLILTNDGPLANELAHPKYEVQKTYVAKVQGRVTPAVIDRLKTGVTLSDGFIAADQAKLITRGSSNTHSIVEITLHSGKNRIVRRLLDHVGHPVEELVRRQFGPLHIGSLALGEMRELSDAERGALLTAASAFAAGSPKKARKITAGRPGDGKGARGMRGVASRGNPGRNLDRDQEDKPGSTVRSDGQKRQKRKGSRS